VLVPVLVLVGSNAHGHVDAGQGLHALFPRATVSPAPARPGRCGRPPAQVHSCRRQQQSSHHSVARDAELPPHRAHRARAGGVTLGDEFDELARQVVHAAHQRDALLHAVE
jgi:hypothetical protein